MITHIKYLICKYCICNIVFVFEIQYKILYFFHWSYNFYFEYATVLLKLGKTVVLFLHYDCIMILNLQMYLYWVKCMHHNEREEMNGFERCEKLWGYDRLCRASLFTCMQAGDADNKPETCRPSKEMRLGKG